MLHELFVQMAYLKQTQNYFVELLALYLQRMII